MIVVQSYKEEVHVMKINEVEKLLGITKANIRFYEKEGLISPTRSENVYLDYNEPDIAQLKQVIILRKMGTPVQQIADILDGVLPLQDALDSNIEALQSEIEKLNGSLALCRQLKSEDTQTLDTERYWEIVQEKEQQGFQFQSIVYDYLNFMRPILEWVFWYIPEGEQDSLWKVLKCILILSAISAGLAALTPGHNFLSEFVSSVLNAFRTILIWAVLLLVPYLLSKKNPKKGKRLRTIIIISTAVICFILILVILTYSVASAA